MRLLFLSNLYPPYDRGGLEQLCHEMTARLQQRGHTVRVLTSQYGVNGQTPHDPAVIRALYLEADINYYRPLDFFTQRRRHEADNLNALRRTIDEFKPDRCVVWGMWNLSRALPHLIEQLLPERVAYYIASYWPAEADMHAQYWNLPANRSVGALVKAPLRALALAQLKREKYPPQLQLRRVRCVSQYVRDTLVKAGAAPHSTGVLFLGIDPEPFLRSIEPAAPTSDAPLRLIYFGSLVADKGVHTAIEALGELKTRGLADKVHLTIVGGGHPAYEAQLRTLTTEAGLTDRVEFVGRVPRADVPAWLSRSDVFLFTSIWAEPMARSVMEAMAARLLVIGSEVGGQIEMMQHGQNALTYQAGDASALANVIELAFNDPARRARLAQAGQHMILERFTLQRMVTDFEAWLNDLTV
ncbi:MAG: glycosyltransferase family 4 protein [Chloroflexi bacterium]|nr:glycosyltransferase family 4 protein [Chloroflexota bacterium]